MNTPTRSTKSPAFVVVGIFLGVFVATATVHSLLPAMSVFIHHVLRVVGWTAEEKVIWLAAGAVVAMVKYTHSSRDWPIGPFPCKPVRPSPLALDSLSAVPV